MRALVRLLAVIVLAGLGLAGAVAAMTPQVTAIATAFDGEAPALPGFAPLAQRSVVFDATGKEIDQLYVENREPFTLAQVPPDVVDAVLAVEDAGFFAHRGVNAKGILRAVLRNLSAASTTQGGSTITQQLVKNAFTGAQRNADRKIQEAVLAVRLEQEFSKEFILERYLNTVYFGNNAYGLEAAAETYFSKSVTELGLSEGAFLAGLIQNPVGYDPIARSDRARRRFRQVGDRLVAVGKLTKAEADVLVETFPIPEKLGRQPAAPKARDYFTAEIRRQLLNTNLLGDTYQERYNKVFRGGLRVYTTFDPRLQQLAEQARDDQFPVTPDNRFDLALVTLDNTNGAVRALVAGRDYAGNEVNLALTPRQTGSSIKGFILAAALNAGIQPADLIDGRLPCTWRYPDGRTKPFVIDDGETFGTSERLDRMTWLSSNCAYTRLYFAVGGPRVIETAKRMGVTRAPLQDIFAFAVGGNEISPLEMAAGYSTIANLGVARTPYFIDRIEDPSGRVLFQHTDTSRQALSPEVAATAVDVLKGVIRAGTATRARLADARPAAGKTGTYTENTHSWFIGFTPQYTTSVYIGNPRFDDPMRNVPEFRKPAPGQLPTDRVQGGTYPALVWKQFMDAAHEGLEAVDWPEPPKAPRAPARIYAPGFDCFGQFVAAPATTTGANPPGGATPTASGAPTTAPAVVFTPVRPKVDPIATDPTDLTGPAATVPTGFVTYSCGADTGRPSTPATTKATAGPATSSTSSTATTKAPATTVPTTKKG